MPEPDIQYVIDEVLKDKGVLTELDKHIFQKTPFIEIAKILGDRFGIESKSSMVPKIISELRGVAPSAFEKLGIYVQPFELEFRMNDITEKTWKDNIVKKKEFEVALDDHISKSYLIERVTNDLDILGDAQEIANVIQNEELAKAYREIGKMHLKSLSTAVTKNGADITMCMRVFNKDGAPMAVHSALMLYEELGGNVKVFDYDEGEKWGSISTFEVAKDCNKQIEDLLGQANSVSEEIRKVSRETGLAQAIIKTFKSDSRQPTYTEAKILENYLNNVGQKSCDLVKEKKVSVTIHREFFPTWSGFKVGVPQPHKKFSAYIISDWDSLSNHISHTINQNKPPAPVPKETLMRYA